MLLQRSTVLSLLLCLLFQTGTCFLPARIGYLASLRSETSISGLVYLLDRSTVYIKDFQFQSSSPSSLSLHLNGRAIKENDEVSISDVGEGTELSLVCRTNSPTCCRGPDNPNGGGQGEWYFPDGNLVPSPRNRGSSQFYRARGEREIRLNRIRGAVSPTGRYCCRLPTASGVDESICVNLVSRGDQSSGDAHFCFGYSADSSRVDGRMTPGFNSPHSRDHIEIPLPASLPISQLRWVGVCSPNDGILARISIIPSATLSLPCKAMFLGILPNSGGEEISGQVYLVNRVTFAIIGFSYNDNNGNDAVFLTGVEGPNVNDYQLAIHGNDVTTSLGRIVDQDCLLTIPQSAEGQALTYLSVWSRSRNRPVSTMSFSSNSIPALPDTIQGVRINKFVPRLHAIAGTAYAFNDRDLYIQRFNYDGTGPAVTFRAIRGRHFNDLDEYADLLDERGRPGNLRAYNFEDIVITLPEGWTVHNTDQLIVWCEEFRTSFGEVTFPSIVSFAPQNYVPIQPPPPTPEQECPPLPDPEIPKNCKRLHEDLTMSWVLDEDTATIELCGCNAEDQYLAFGLSGHNNRIQMLSSDPVWAWLDETGVHAEELKINALTQCNLRTGANGQVTETGVCPEGLTNSARALSGYKEGCTTCIKFTRPIGASDRFDKAITPGTSQWVVWAVGPVGTLATPTGTTIPIPFKHYLRPEYTDSVALDFGRAPKDECGPITCQCDRQQTLLPWRQPYLEHSFTYSARIGQSGGIQGYAGITGIVGWGISIYLNGLLIPNVQVYRGFTYTFVTETGDDPNNPTRYHPFYITSSQRGGYMTLSPQDQRAETIYAGRDDSGKWLGAGRFCFYGPDGPDMADKLSSFEEYKDTLSLKCDEGAPATFTWTVDEDTPDIVYYQCATHQYLGWKINVVEPPPELRPIELKPSGISPAVIGRSVQMIFYTTKRPESPLVCQLRNKETGRVVSVRCVNDFGNSYIYNQTNLAVGEYEIIITVNKGRNDEIVFTRYFEIFADPLSCGVHLNRNGITFERGVINVEFSAVGLFDSFLCTTNGQETYCNRGSYSSDGASLTPTGWNRVCIRVEGCDGEEEKSLMVWVNIKTGETDVSFVYNCSGPPPISTVTTTTTIQPSVTPTPSEAIQPTSTAVASTTAIIYEQISTDMGVSTMLVFISPSATIFESSTPSDESTSESTYTSTSYEQSTSTNLLIPTTLVEISPSAASEQLSSTIAMATSTSEGVVVTPTPPTDIPDIGVTVDIVTDGLNGGCTQITSSSLTLLLSTAVTMISLASQLL